MLLRRALTAVGGGVTTFLLVAVVVIELLYFEFSALVGIPLGVLAGLAAVAGLWLTFPGLSPVASHAATAFAAFGLATLLLFALSTVDVGGDLLSLDVMAGVGLVVAGVVYLLFWVDERATRV